MTPVRQNIFKFFREYQHEKELTNKDGLEHFVSGEFQDNIFNGGGLLYRDAITMDFDELPPAMNVKEFEKLITSKLPNISYIIHASWSYSDENQIRKIHLIIPTKQRILTASHYYNCHLYLERIVGEIADKNLRSWGHLLSLPAYHNKENMVICERGELFDASIVAETYFNEHEQIEHTINQQFRRIPENESDPIVAAFIAHYQETKLLEDNFYLGRIYTVVPKILWKLPQITR